MRGKIRDGRGFLCWQPIEKHRMLAFRMVICEPVLLRQRDDCGLRHWDLHEHTPPVGCANFGHDACKFLFQGFHARNGPCTNLDGRTSKAALAPADEGGGGATEAADATNCTHRNCHCYYGCVGVCIHSFHDYGSLSHSRYHRFSFYWWKVLIPPSSPGPEVLIPPSSPGPGGGQRTAEGRV